MHIGDAIGAASGAEWIPEGDAAVIPEALVEAGDRVGLGREGV